MKISSNFICPICKSGISFKLVSDETSCSSCKRIIKLRPRFLSQKNQKFLFGLIGIVIIISTTLYIRMSEIIEYELGIVLANLLIACGYYIATKCFYFNFQRVEVHPPK